jgi:Zn-dependent peptidase ImmA (M78 family)/transcriptional regulator with XRE-family HTH domain
MPDERRPSRDDEIGQRITAARITKGITQASLADALGVGPTVMSKIEAGKRRLDGFELAVLAEALGTTSRALLGMTSRTSGLAAAARIGAGNINPALGRARELLELDGIADELGLDGRAAPRRLDRPTPRTKSGASELAREVLASTSAGNGGITDLIRLVERDFGIDVAVEPLGNGPAGVLVQHADDIALVVLNGDDHAARRRFTLAHELGHWLLGDSTPLVVDTDLGGNTDIERRANHFAIELLLPEDAVRGVFNSSADLVCGVVDGLVHFGVSRDAFVNRLSALRLVDQAQATTVLDNQVKTLFLHAGRQADYTAWVGNTPTRRLPSRIERRLINAYSNGRIGIGLLSQAFGESPVDLATRLEADGITVNITLDHSALSHI